MTDRDETQPMFYLRCPGSTFNGGRIQIDGLSSLCGGLRGPGARLPGSLGGFVIAEDDLRALVGALDRMRRGENSGDLLAELAESQREPNP